MLKCKKVEKLFPLDQMVIKRLCNNVAEKLKKFSRRDRRCHCDNAKIFEKTISALSNGDNARIVKSFKRRCEM